jgi:hydrogenase maturation factor
VAPLATPAVGSHSGLVRFIRYAFMPNHLGYCGGRSSEVLLEHGSEGRADSRLTPLLAEFSGAVPYLRTIAGANGIGDPFDPRVVEAYWLGNDLLARVEAGDLYRSLEERFGRQLPTSVRDQVLRKPPRGAKPYHLFHVVDVYRHLESDQVGMAAMESCRVSWGQVTSIEKASLVARRRPLVLQEGRLALGEPRAEPVAREVLQRGFVDDVVVGDWISIHWGWACEVLTERQRSNLERWTRHHLALANQTI